MGIAIFGGSFNPIHNGHINMVNGVLSDEKTRNSIDKLIIIPTYISPFKQNAKNIIPGKNRIELCKIAFEDYDKIEVSDYEITKQDVSYTIDTLLHFKKIYPQEKIYLCVGSDSLESLPRWKNAEKILSIASIISISRSDSDTKKLDEYSTALHNLNNNTEIITLNIEPFDISSTEIRKKIINNEEISCYCPEKVVKYILSNGLKKYLKDGV